MRKPLRPFSRAPTQIYCVTANWSVKLDALRLMWHCVDDLEGAFPEKHAGIERNGRYFSDGIFT